MNIFNVRLGLATNSSSSHSIIILKDGVAVKDFSGHPDDPEDVGSFGWQKFTAASPEAKLRYLGVMLRDRMYEVLPHNIAAVVCDNWLGGTFTTGDYIDHQSRCFLPSAFNSTFPDEEFFNDLKNYLLSDRVAILGGNDNSETQHPLDDGTAFTLPLPMDYSSHSSFTCRYDNEKDYWTLFDKESGNKLRFRLTPNSGDFTPPDKASAPELVDIKITNYCPFGCEFCYQSSTARGKHVEYADMYRIARSLGALKVFEVALGGGEPTMHPKFESFLDLFRDNGIVPNFTTKNIHWLRDPRKWVPWVEKCGAFAFSVTDANEISELASQLEVNGIPTDKCRLHFVMGTMNRYSYQQMLTEANRRSIGVTLLGYKRFGFGADFHPQQYDWWLQVVQEMVEQSRWCQTVSIDTVLASESRQMLEDANVPRWLYTVDEGKFSCYIDAVEDKIGPSSFCDPREMMNLGAENDDPYRLDDSHAIREAFRLF
jgi:hypothetical protein